MSQRGWHRWTKAEHRLLVQKYMKHGDGDIARMLNERFPKGYPWTIKHVEKRRNYFGLHRGRTAGQCFDNRRDMKKHWDTRGRMKNGDVRTWEGVEYIKVRGKVKLLRRHVMKARPGQVVRTFGNELRVISRADHAIMNKSAGLPPELQECIMVLTRLKRLAYGKENRRPARNTV